MASIGKGLPVVGEKFSGITFRTAFKIIERRFDDVITRMENIVSVGESDLIGLNDLIDVSVDSATNGQSLTFDAANNLWIPATITGGVGGSEPDASESVKGIVRLATIVETTDGMSNSLAIHPLGLVTWFQDITIDGGSF